MRYRINSGSGVGLELPPMYTSTWRCRQVIINLRRIETTVTPGLPLGPEGEGRTSLLQNRGVRDSTSFDCFSVLSPKCILGLRVLYYTFTDTKLVFI